MKRLQDKQNIKSYFQRKLPNNGMNTKWQKQNRIWKFFVSLYFLAILFSSDHITAGYFLKHRLGIDKLCNETYRIAIIDSAFDISKLNPKNIVAQRNIADRSPIITKTPIFDYSGNIKCNNHGTDIANLFIGPHGLLPNAQIIPIQVNSANDLPAAIDHALNVGAQAITISLSFAPNYHPLPYAARSALLKASERVPVLIAAGNDGQALESTCYGRSMLTLAQASYKPTNQGRIFLVASTKFSMGALGNTNNEKLSNFSNYSQKNSKHVLKAPGENIKLGNFAIQTLGINALHGTSIATPLALIKAIYLVNKQQKKYLIKPTSTIQNHANSEKLTILDALIQL